MKKRFSDLQVAGASPVPPLVWVASLKSRAPDVVRSSPPYPAGYNGKSVALELVYWSRPTLEMLDL